MYSPVYRIEIPGGGGGGGMIDYFMFISNDCEHSHNRRGRERQGGEEDSSYVFPKCTFKSHSSKTPFCQRPHPTPSPSPTPSPCAQWAAGITDDKTCMQSLLFYTTCVVHSFMILKALEILFTVQRIAPLLRLNTSSFSSSPCNVNLLAQIQKKNT